MILQKQEIATLVAQPDGTNIYIKWYWLNDTVAAFVKKTLVFYIKEGDSNVYSLQHSENNFNTEYIIVNVTQNVNYNICIRPMMTAAWSGVRDAKICTNITNNKWEMPAFIGSIAGALLAIFLIILLVFMSRRVRSRQKKLYKSNADNKNLQRPRYDSALDSVINKDDISFYDDYLPSEASNLDSSFRWSGETSVSTSTTPSTIVNGGDEPSSKPVKKRTSLIEEETNINQLSDSLIHTVTVEDDINIHQADRKSRDNRKSPSHSLNESKYRIVETCIDDIDSLLIPRTVDIRPKSLSPKMRLAKCPQKASIYTK